MNPEHVQLCRRIWDFPLDEATSTFPFTARLAWENGWSQEIAHRVVREYKRFAFLAVVAGHPVAPSDEVDQAWHLHLTYTRSYWEKFCPEVLGKLLHHHPTQGGAAEQAKFRDWYDKTLNSYQRFFGHARPADIWPDANTNFGSGVHRRVDTSRHWVIPKRPLQWITGIAVLVLLTVFVTAGCSAVPAGSVSTAVELPSWMSGNPLDLPGADFLKWFAAAFAGAVAIAAIVRWLFRGSGRDAELESTDLCPYETAYLAGGEQGALHAVLAGLVDRGVLTFDAANRRLLRTKMISEETDSLHPAERAILGAVDQFGEWGTPLDELQKGWAWSTEIADRLKSVGLVVSEVRETMGRVVPTLIVLLVPVMGAIKILVGVSRDRPMGFLFFGSIFAAYVAFAMFAERMHRTRRGNQVLKRLKREHAVLQQGLDGTEAGNVPLAVGLFGIGVLAGGALDGFQAALKPKVESGNGGCGANGCGGGCGGCGGCGG